MNLHNRNRTLGMMIKLVIAVLTGFYLYAHFSKHPAQQAIISEIVNALSSNQGIFILVLAMMPINWILESLKWKLLASRVQPISFSRAVQGVIAGVTIGTATPNRIGEFAGRIYSVDSERKKDLLLVSFIGSFCQVFITVLAPVVFVMAENCSFRNVELVITAGVLLGFLVLALPFFTGKFPAYIRNKARILSEFPRMLFLKTLLLSLLRYAIYLTQFALLMKVCCPELPLFSVFKNISGAYFAITIMPTFSVAEVLTRGSIAGFCFGDFHPGEVAFYVAALVWTINVAVPSVVGIFFLFRLKFFSKE